MVAYNGLQISLRLRKPLPPPPLPPVVCDPAAGMAS